MADKPGNPNQLAMIELEDKLLKLCQESSLSDNRILVVLTMMPHIFQLWRDAHPEKKS